MALGRGGGVDALRVQLAQQRLPTGFKVHGLEIQVECSVKPYTLHTMGCQCGVGPVCALLPNTVELILTLGTLSPRGGPVQDPVLTRRRVCCKAGSVNPTGVHCS